MSSPGDTIVALATPVGTSAIAVVRASGPRCAELVREIFGETPLPRQARHADYRATDGRLLDDVLFTFFAGPNSFTGEDTLEVSSHGNPFIAQLLIEDLVRRGCRPAEPGEYSKRAFLNGRMDLSQAEAVMDLIQARSERALAAANRQLRGALGRRMEAVTSRLVSVVAQVEAYIDFPEEDLPVESRELLGREIAFVQDELGQLLATSHYGTMLRDGIRTVIIGETNAGKSSLLNQLLGRERALVSAEPGTTRDYLEERVLVGPHALRLVDTAGLNRDASALEKRGIEKTLEQAVEADLFLWVVDSTLPLPPTPLPVRKRLMEKNCILVLNKTDLPGEAVILPTGPFSTCRISALTGAGIEELRSAITSFADAFQIAGGDEGIAINVRHSVALADAQATLGRSQELLASGESGELLASELRSALASCGEIAGRVDNEQILDRLFATFCIGK